MIDPPDGHLSNLVLDILLRCPELVAGHERTDPSSALAHACSRLAIEPPAAHESTQRAAQRIRDHIDRYYRPWRETLP